VLDSGGAQIDQFWLSRRRLPVLPFSAAGPISAVGERAVFLSASDLSRRPVQFTRPGLSPGADIPLGRS
jgi:hypothetical protein